jgi:hypothetical protein
LVNKINILAAQHKQWVAIVEKFGEHTFSEDIVQEMYMKVIRCNHIDKCVNNGKVNRSYVYMILRTLHGDFDRYKKVLIKKKLPIDECRFLTNEESTLDEQEAYENIKLKINEETLNWHPFDKLTFDIYTERKLSIRKIAEKSNIHYMTIFTTLKRCKQKLRENVGESYEDYLNKDYELI